jgi:hypothetical protein
MGVTWRATASAMAQCEGGIQTMRARPGAQSSKPSASAVWSLAIATSSPALMPLPRGRALLPGSGRGGRGEQEAFPKPVLHLIPSPIYPGRTS